MKGARTAPKGAFDFEGLTVSLKRYPDTKPFPDTKAVVFALVLFILVGFLVGRGQLWAQKQAWEKIPVAKLPAFHPPQPKRIELPNGMVVFCRKTTSCQ